MRAQDQANFRSFITVVLTLGLLLVHGRGQGAEFSLGTARVHGAIGETGHLFLVPNGMHARPLYNDIFGHTDKHLSGEAQLGYVATQPDLSWETIGSWRFLTPCFREDFSKDPLPNPVGRYADWLELQGAWARVMNWSGYEVRLQGGLGYGDISDKGARSVHRMIHAKVGSTLEGLDYINQPAGAGISRNLEMGLIQSWKLLPSWKTETLFNLGYSNNLMTEELYLNVNALAAKTESWAWALEANVIQHVSSRAYGNDMRDHRWELAVGLRRGFWRPTLKFVSPFLKGDAVGQIYFDPLAFVVEF